ncbi:hypothetical protein [Streptomyces sp. NRRL S-87]|uniref:hypothetical protein n=1 Tax=Streptomyces sp. NRRL S-87 TaxID=1463920 RepID=UPI0004C16CBD|nr:hypothetical protein [Streptomyces sp. NRRL S-87]
MRRISLLAAAGLMALGLTTPAHAAGPDYAVSGPTEVGLNPYPAKGSPKKTTVDIGITNPTSRDFHGTYTLTLDLAGLKGVADVALGEVGDDCERTADTLVCEGSSLWAGGRTVVQLRLTAAKGAEDGAHGTVAVTGKAAGIRISPRTTTVTVGGPDLVMQRLHLKNRMEVGDRQATPISFVNKGTRPADGVVLELLHTRGLEFVEKYDNCTFHPNGPQQRGWGTTVCTFEGSFEPKYVYELDAPLHLKATQRAWYDSFIYRIKETGAASTALNDSKAGPKSGVRIGAKRVLAQPYSSDLNPWDNQQEFDFQTTNTADFAATPLAFDGTAGETVKARFGFRNQGPAWIGNIRSGEPVATVDVRVPAGASVTRKPKACAALSADGTPRERQLGAPRYRCQSGYAVLDGATVTFPFELRVDRVVPDAKGSVAVGTWAPDGRLGRLAFDPKHANDTAALVLNPTRVPTQPTPGATASPTTGATPAATPSATGGATPSATAPTTAGPGGNLASTGSSAALLAGAAAIALVGGTGLFLATRRRTGRHT